MHILVCKQNNSVTDKKKQDIWQKITPAVNEAEGGLGNRTVEEVKKKRRDSSPASKTSQRVEDPLLKSHPTAL